MSPDVRAPIPLTQTVSAAPKLGPTLRHFRIDKPIAQGGMGEVYLGFDTSLSRPVALKIIRAALAQDHSFTQRFVREAQAQANVVHPHVVQVYYAGEENGVWFLAMQLVDGGSLEDVLTRGQRLSWQDAARHMLGVAEGMVEASRSGIVHRDIKPANLLLDRGGEVHLSDFGLATTAGAAQEQVGAPSAGPLLWLPNVTQVGTVLGTLAYMPPEQLRGEPLDARADIYALGASFYHLLTGDSPITANTPPEALEAHARGLAPVQEKAPRTPRQLAEVIDRCLSPEAKDRYPTHAELAEAVRRALPQPSVNPSPVLRLLAWFLDLAPFLLVLRFTYVKAPWLAPVLMGVTQTVALLGLHATLGLWLLRLRLRTTEDTEVSLGRGLGRTALVHGWLVVLAVSLRELYASSPLASSFIVACAVLLAINVLGAVLAFFTKGQTLYDRLTGTRVLVDVR